ncbi:unnamed protein product [Rotaria sp. Silwood1]|nr:unnamed protein product [Rotaria sp. Silwood1]
MTNISSDVDHLRDEYNTRKSKNNELIVHYHDRQMHDGDELKKADTQTVPKVQIKIEPDLKNSYFILVMTNFDAS